MARNVRHDAEGPAIIDEEEFEDQGGTVAICQCGLSDNKPYCDGSHQGVADEEEGVVYKYENDDDENDRRVVGEE
ncbi:MAG: CDGSH iron-sulfur domain-containing protein [Salinirussus sp.]